MRLLSTALKWSVFPILLACSRDAGSDAIVKLSGKLSGTGKGFGPSALPQSVTASPDAAKEFLLPTNLTPVALASWVSGPEVALVVRDTSGAQRVVAWTAGDDRTSPVVDLPKGFVARAIATHPARRILFVAGSVRDTSQILALASDGNTWRSTLIFKSPSEIGTLIVGTRPFSTRDSVRYRVFFSAKLADGTSSLRSVTETGKVEYQVAGPKSAIVQLKDEDAQPGGPIVPSATPAAFHPRGEPLIWQDRRGCAHALAYGDQVWGKDHSISTIPCGGSISMTPNGVFYLQWQNGQAGVGVIRDGRGSVGRQATGYTFSAAPVSAPDGRGVIGIVSKDKARSALVYAPITVSFPDVVNAWQFADNSCRDELLIKNAGAFVPTSGQLYSLYDRDRYRDGPESPFIVTTDLFWENFGAAFNGVFIALERRHATSAFWSFVNAANKSMSTSMSNDVRNSTWANVFAALAGVHQGVTTGEAGRIANDTAGLSEIIAGDPPFTFAELKPRSHYTSSPEMQQYFRAVHYLTEAGRLMDPKELASLPPDVHRKALEWINVYRPFVAPSRATLVWTTAPTPLAPYAKRPWAHTTVFPLGWGVDNETLESSVYHKDWPVEEQIRGPMTIRDTASGVDVASVFGSVFAKSILRPEFDAFPRLRPVLDGITSRRPPVDESTSIYERWLNALAVEWADSTKFPGAPAASPVWSAKRLQTGLASWATMREATILVNERPSAAEAGEGGFEELILDRPRGYVEPAPKTFEAIASLYEALAKRVATMTDLGDGAEETPWQKDAPLRKGILDRLTESAAEARRFGQMAEKELHGETLSDAEYDAIRDIGGSAEHQFLLYKSLAEKNLAISIPEPIGKIADVAGDLKRGVLEVAVGNPLAWYQITPYFGRRQITIGSTYSYYEFYSKTLYDNNRWRSEIDSHERPAWIQPLLAPSDSSCHATASP